MAYVARWKIATDQDWRLFALTSAFGAAKLVWDCANTYMEKDAKRLQRWTVSA